MKRDENLSVSIYCDKKYCMKAKEFLASGPELHLLEKQRKIAKREKLRELCELCELCNSNTVPPTTVTAPVLMNSDIADM